MVYSVFVENSSGVKGVRSAALFLFIRARVRNNAPMKFLDDIKNDLHRPYFFSKTACSSSLSISIPSESVCCRYLICACIQRMLTSVMAKTIGIRNHRQICILSLITSKTPMTRGFFYSIGLSFKKYSCQIKHF